MNYQDFLENKTFVLASQGFETDMSELNPHLFDYQRDIVRWALAKGRAAVFTDCGTGKSLIELEFGHQVHCHTGYDVLIVAPLSVVDQTRREGEKFGIPVNVCASQDDVKPGLNITNYEKLEHFIAAKFGCIVLDESSILKSYSGKIRNQIISCFTQTPYKLACTATPAPNDYMELGNHSEFLGVMTRPEMLSMFFVHDGGQTSKWRLKGHAESLYWQWMASWAVFMDSPKTLGYGGEGFDLPPLNVHEVIVDSNMPIQETLTLTERRDARRNTIALRCQKSVEIALSSGGQVIIWCGLNAEQDQLEELLGDQCFSIRGSTPDAKKIEYERRWREGERLVLITKPEIGAWGMNWQQCHTEIFTGLSDSYEQYYQAVRRCWRFGQTEPVDVYIVISALEGCVKANIERKEADSNKMKAEMVKYTKDITKKELAKTCRLSTPYAPQMEMRLPEWLQKTA